MHNAYVLDHLVTDVISIIFVRKVVDGLNIELINILHT